MARISGVNIPTNKRVEIALTYIFGIGRTKAREICEKVGLPLERRVNELAETEVLQIHPMPDRRAAFASCAEARCCYLDRASV